MSETADTQSVVVERRLPHAPAKVWRAMTESDLLARWMMKNDFAPEVGRRFALRAEPMPHWDGVVNCEVLALEPPRRMVWRWGVGSGENALVTTITFTLTPDGAGAHLRMEQSGFRPDQENNRRGAQYGLSKMVDALAALLPEIEG
jgi:uncharacterized protein YndB with AHSA1/START domain